MEQIRDLKKENDELKKRVDALEKKLAKDKPPKKEVKEGKVAEHKLLKTEAE
jgi:hypothetical protein